HRRDTGRHVVRSNQRKLQSTLQQREMYYRGAAQNDRRGQRDRHGADARVSKKVREQRAGPGERRRGAETETEVDPEQIAGESVIEMWPLENRFGKAVE